jgi:mannitol operon repressor
MAWLHMAERELEQIQETIAEIEGGSDRAAAIVAAAFVEDHLATALQRRMRENAKIVAELFRSSGPLGSFSAKIDMAFLLGLITEEAHKELHAIRAIRNLFAHTLGKLSFNSGRILNLSNNLVYADNGSVTFFPPGITDFCLFLLPKSDSDKLLEPRTRFIRACEFFIGALSLVRSMRPNTPDI